MSTSVDTLRQWFDDGLAAGAKYMVIVCDTFDWSDFPLFYTTEDAAQRRVSSPGPMEKIMEVYDLTADRESQLNGGARVWALRP